MLTDKEAKKKFRGEFYKNPDKYYATEYLKKEGFSRHICKKCEKPFWSTDASRLVCGDPACGTIPFSFIGNTPAKNKLEYVEVWTQFAKMFEKFGYTPIKRYPIVARWNPTMEYTNASIAAFQPYVISGEVEPPAKKLVIPQFCFRTVDIDNVGITGSHNTVFSMIGQHQFVKPSEWDQNEALEHIHTWLKKGLGLPNEEITFHEDAWAGGGNLGPCMEFFSRGCELGNQVYMMYEQTDTGVRGLDLKVLDMGMGQERNAWFSQGNNTQYDATFPTVIDYLLKQTGLKFDKDLQKRYVPYGGLLNLDEIEDVDKAWQTVADKIETDVETLKRNILPLAGLYSVAEHSRALMIMFRDGAIPSNVGDSYNLRIIFRRMMGFIDKYGWNIDVYKLFDMHASQLKSQCPEFKDLEIVKKIFDVEKEKYEKNKDNAKRMAERWISNRKTTGAEEINELVELYDSHGINPELITNEAKKMGVHIVIPENFYTLVSERHEKREQKHATKKNIGINLSSIPPTSALYFDDYKKAECTATVVKISGKYVVLDQTVAYPTSGGQMHDNGKINGEVFEDVIKEGPHIVHILKDTPKFREGQKVKVRIDLSRRLQLAKHHTATHIVNEAARRVLGDHINQASAFKDVDKAHLDITHFSSITEDELEEIEKEANRIVKQDKKIEKKFVKRNDAEQKYGFGIYQGGAVPGKELRIVNITGTDVEACGGTHLDSTGEAEKIIIMSAERVQDNISRITFAAGPAAEQYEEKVRRILKEAEIILGVKEEELSNAAEKLLEDVKDARKRGEKETKQRAVHITENLEDQIINNILITQISNADMKMLQNISMKLSNDQRLLILFGTADRTYVFASSGKNSRHDAGKIVREICEELGGKGGGTKSLAQGVAPKKDLERIIAGLAKKLH
jgi:alanyl-tRNA synthetase